MADMSATIPHLAGIGAACVPESIVDRSARLTMASMRLSGNPASLAIRRWSRVQCATEQLPGIGVALPGAVELQQRPTRPTDPASSRVLEVNADDTAFALTPAV